MVVVCLVYDYCVGSSKLVERDWFYGERFMELTMK